MAVFLHSHPTFARCHKAVNYKQFLNNYCLEAACNCMMANNGDPAACKCNILESFVKKCLSVNPLVQLTTWRAVAQCEINCPAPLVHTDCYKRRCEPSCDNVHGDDCPVLPDACFPGCYCPEGTVRKGPNCVPSGPGAIKQFVAAIEHWKEITASGIAKIVNTIGLASPGK